MKLRINEKETPNIEVKDSNFTNNTIMIITIFSEMSSDGCDIEIVNGNKVLFKDSYRYGYNASYNRKYAKYAHQDVINAQKYSRTGYIERPYIGDIITELCKKYNIDKHDIIFKQGKNVFNGDNVSSKKVSDFINNHIDGIVEESYKKLKEQNVDIEVKHEGILEVPEGKNVDDLPLSHFVNLANKKGLSKITKALNNLQVWNKNDNPKLSKWAGNMIDKLNKKLKKDESLIKERKFNDNVNLLDADEHKIIEVILETMKEYVDTFNKRLPHRINNEYVISARYACGSYYDFYIDYSAIRKLYTKEEAKIALNTFNEFCNILTTYLDVLKFKYPDIEYIIDKTEVSSAKIGEELYVSKFPFKFPNEYYEDGMYI